MAVCSVCFRHCSIEEGGTGFCGGRVCRDGRITAGNYGRITALALDPIEKKPLARFYPGSRILSVGSYGCNLRCPFCQNHDISWPEEARRFVTEAETVTPEELAEAALRYKSRGNIGVAFTYNEPLIGYEFVRDTAYLVRQNGMKNVLVTNGTAELSILEEILPYIDAMNIDLKGFTDRYYREVLDGSRQMVLDFIARAVQTCHVELTTLIIPGENDAEEEMREMTAWIAGLPGGTRHASGKEIPLHITRFFPRFHMTDREATKIRTIFRLAETAKEQLTYVYTGNV
ncbi:MAG: AmmeMemoRadiSam system radical SAM enzyme [Eubacterium sp.]|nr:AmmeMemoRadiSam system radical SAM enzyme [Eubacterium sp.]